MIDIPRIFGSGFFGSILRKTLAIIPAEMPLFILQGELVGKKWIKGAGVNGYWLGTYEIQHQKLIKQNLKEGSVFYDVGAHTGYFSLLASKVVGQGGQVYCFEPLPKNVGFLERHIELNHAANCEIVNVCVSDKSGEVKFQDSESTFMGKISQEGNRRVRSITLDEFVRSGKKPPTLIKIDVEGLQEKVLMGAIETIKTYRPTIVLEAQFQPHEKENFYSILKEIGYNIQPIGTDDLHQAGDFIATAH